MKGIIYHHNKLQEAIKAVYIYLKQDFLVNNQDDWIDIMLDRPNLLLVGKRGAYLGSIKDNLELEDHINVLRRYSYILDYKKVLQGKVFKILINPSYVTIQATIIRNLEPFRIKEKVA